MLEARQRLGDFEIVRPLGKGGMGEVYEAQQDNPSRRVALKVLGPWLAAHADAVDRFRRETDVLARLDHPNIVRIFTSDRTSDGTFYFTMQLVRGASLARLLKAGAGRPKPAAAQVTVSGPDGPAAPAAPPPAAPGAAASDEVDADLLRAYREDHYGFVVRAGVAVAGALAAAHHESVLHRDLKPGNVMADRRGHFYLLDFGLARLLDADDGTQSGIVKGTPWYMSPEQARAEPLDARSDVYSLGVTLYELATGGVGPFAATRSDHEEVLRQVRAGRLRPLRELAPGIPEGLAQVIDKATRFRPDERYQAAADMLADLTACRRGAVVRPALPSAPQTRDYSPRRRRPPAGVLLAALGLALAVGWALSAWRPRADPATEEWFPWPKNPLVRVRPVREPIPLFKKGRVEPIWAQLLRGDPDWCRPQPDRLWVTSLVNTNRFPTFVLLDYDTRGRWYEYEIKVKAVPSPVPGRNEVGLIFGYRRLREDPGRSLPCFAVRLCEREAAAGGPRLLVGWLLVEEADGGKRPRFQPFEPFPGDAGALPLPATTPQSKGWRAVRVRAFDGVVTIVVDHVPPVRINLEALKAAAPAAEMTELDPRGGVGIWVGEGVAFFADAFVTPLPSERLGP